MSIKTKTIDVDVVYNAFVDAALYTATDGSDQGNPLKLTTNRFTKKARASMLAIVEKFLAENTTLLLKCTTARKNYKPYSVDHAAIGHDLLMTMQGQGVGFWEGDHCTDNMGEVLTKKAKGMGYWCEPYVYAANGWLHFEPTERQVDTNKPE